ncbi:hypothetical protein D9599_28185, partial [Roseomonas sp. KE2513]|uniref:hypothetical protein n=1 Tax=Roseomonas sp. KE2513 TaxID=2479202 RepID=UPI001E29511D
TAEAGLAMNPQAVALVRVMALVDQRSGRLEAALGWAQRAVELAPQDQRMHAFLNDLQIEVALASLSPSEVEN